MTAAINPKDFGKVAVLMGGLSAEREVSLMSGLLVGCLNTLFTPAHTQLSHRGPAISRDLRPCATGRNRR